MLQKIENDKISICYIFSYYEKIFKKEMYTFLKHILTLRIIL